MSEYSGFYFSHPSTLLMNTMCLSSLIWEGRLFNVLNSLAWKAFSGFLSQHQAWFNAPLLRRVWPCISPLVEKEFKWILTYIKLSMTYWLKAVSICSLMKKIATATTDDQTKTFFLQLKNTTVGRSVSLKTNNISKVSVEGEQVRVKQLRLKISQKI